MKCVLSAIVLATVVAGAGCGRAQSPAAGSTNAARTTAPLATNSSSMKEPVVKTDAEWKQTLTPEQYRVLRQKGTERAFTGSYWNHHDKGLYRCAGCGQALFLSDTKFDSGCGWPSFFQPIATNVVFAQTDDSLFMHRTEITCAKCGGHLGHVFDDGPPPTGLRYCINSASLTFEPPAGETNRPAASPPKK